jgi:flagellar basal-body rod modification protein FlgD
MTTISAAAAPDILAQLGQSAAGAAKPTSDTQSRFLTLLVSQLKNQDPLNPLDNAQVTSQMAQLSTVDGIEKTNAAIAALSDRFDNLQTMQGATLVGRQVLIEGQDLNLHAGVARAGAQLDAPADHVTVSIKDNTGREIRRLELGSQQAGMLQFNWDGLTETGEPAADGRYRFDVEATAAGKAVTASGLTFARVDGVASGPDGFLLSLGGYGNVTLAQVKQII